VSTCSGRIDLDEDRLDLFVLIVNTDIANLEKRGSFIPLRRSGESRHAHMRSRARGIFRVFLPKYEETARSIARLSRDILAIEQFAMDSKITPGECKGPGGKHTTPPDPVPEYQSCLCDLWMHLSLNGRSYPGCICFGCIRDAAEKVQNLALKLPKADQGGSESGSTRTSRLSESIYSTLGRTEDGVSMATFVSRMQDWQAINYHKYVADRVNGLEESVGSGAGGSNMKSPGTTQSLDSRETNQNLGSLTVYGY
jgi:hypothetical protein